ncbi:MAG: NADH:flavin oxidoreductase/NADH oxidase [Cycloclasticus sp.]|nr:NADH:flavin oxidoreductase/NADH oxidase [Cycloclasticus sp.]
MQTKPPLLFSPWRKRELDLNNRIMISPMCTYQAETDGLVHDGHLVHYGQFALGGAGLIMVEATAVEARGRISSGDLGLYSDQQIQPMARLVDYLHLQGSKVGVQLAHAGIKASTRSPSDGGLFLDQSDHEKGLTPWLTVGPTDEPLAPGWPTPKALTINEIEVIINAWGEAAKRAHLAGVDVLEIHGAHGYLISQFLSPICNARSDEYGGDTGRVKLALDITKSIRKNWPASKPLFFRMSVIEGVDIGWNLDDSIKLTNELEALGVDLIDCSSGGVKIGMQGQYALPRQRNYQVFLAEAIKEKTAIATAAVGMILDPQQAEDILQAHQADLIVIGRAALNDPYWPRHAEQHFLSNQDMAPWATNYGWWYERWAKALNV